MSKEKKLYNIDGYMNLASYELKSPKILLEGKQYRDSITHSYYAMFQSAKAMLITKDFESKSHDNTLNEFGKVFIHEGNFNRDLYDAYYNSKRQRKKTSYDFTVDFNKNDAQQRIEQAKNFIIEAENYLSELL